MSLLACLCPGPARTEFNKNAKVQFKMPLLSSKNIANYTVKQMFNHKLVIIPSLRYRLLRTMLNLLPLSKNSSICIASKREKVNEWIIAKELWGIISY
jgi:short-subunit dehydrogenase